MTSIQELMNGIELPSVLVVILNWNGWEETLLSVDSALRLDYPNLRVLVIDNGSVDESVARLEALQNIRVELLKLRKNLGYAGGCNEGLKRSLSLGVEYVWLLNSDAIVDDRNTLRSLVSLAESDPKIGLVSPRLADLKEPNRLTFCGGICSVSPPIWEHTSDPRQAQAWLEDYPHAGMVVGTAMLVRTSIIRDVGLLDEKLFAYFEDNDYSYRSSKVGYRNLVDKQSVVRHEEKDASSRLESIKPHWWYYMTRNECLFWIKHLGFIRGLRVSRWDFQKTLYRMRQCKDNKAALDATLAGLWHGWTNRGGPYRKEYRMPRLLAMVIRKVASLNTQG
jgi:GT2 family glycosyltransferase